MLNENTDFDIRIQDNFLSKEDFDYIKNVSKNINFGPINLTYDNGHSKNHVFFTADAPQKVCDILTKKISNFFKIKILNINTCQYSLVAKSDKTQVHNHPEDTNLSCIIYISGDENIHCGTGFYVKKNENNNFELNTHIGFKPNRIVSWQSNVWHAPLSFTDSYKKRISLITQFKIND
jgi:hypothetical protein